jgi:excisionase family DNA binding protein
MMRHHFEFLTAEQAAEELAVGKSVILALVKAGDLPARRRPGMRTQIERGMFERWIREQYAATRLWLLENPNERLTHADWKD